MKSNAFTLVELLITVAIIAILAAIALPNLLHAQTRAKVARAKSDLRTLAGALEAYSVDYQIPPLDWNVGRGDPLLPGMIDSTSGILHPGVPGGPGLTTPTAYVTNCWIGDPFAAAADFATIPFDQQRYTYNWFAPNPNRTVPANPEYIAQEYDRHYGYWRLGSIGPDRDFFNGQRLLDAASIAYDPSNGTVSTGNIWRSSREADVTLRPPRDHAINPG